MCVLQFGAGANPTHQLAYSIVSMCACVCVCARVCMCVCFSGLFIFGIPAAPPVARHLLAASCLWHGGVVPHRGEYQRICVLVCASSLNFLSVCICVCVCLSVPLCVCGLFTSTSRAVRKILKRDAILLELRANVQLALAVRRVARCELPQQPRTVRKAVSTWRAH